MKIFKTARRKEVAYKERMAKFSTVMVEGRKRQWNFCCAVANIERLANLSYKESKVKLFSDKQKQRVHQQREILKHAFFRQKENYLTLKDVI